MEDDNGITTSRPLSAMPHEIPSLSSAPTGLTRERLDSLIVETWGHDPQTVSETSDDQFVIHEVFGARILRDAILESSSAPTPEME
jgi:hypothetical protein